MRIKFCLSVVVILLLAGCTKTNAPVNFNCKVNGTYMQGTGVTYYTNPPVFQLVMTGPNNQIVTVNWNNIDSVGGIRTQMGPGTYTMSTSPLPPFIASASYASFGINNYITGSGSAFGGSVTITNNTGLGGLMSGTFSFTALNTNAPYDTVYVTAGSFTNVRVGTN